MQERRRLDAAPLCSLYDGVLEEADRFKWIESQQRCYDVGEWGRREWTRRHWADYLRGKRLEHLYGIRHYREFESHTFGKLSEQAQQQRHVVEFIVDRFLHRWENLNFLCVAEHAGCSREELLQLLELMGINLLRRFEPPASLVEAI